MMNFTRRALLFSVAALFAAASASAGTISYSITVNTTGLAGSGPGFIEFQFNQANSLTSLTATASISLFASSGYTFNAGGSGGSTGVTGSLAAPPIVIPNDAGAANFYDIAVTTFGTSFSFLVTLTGDAIGGSAADGSGFFVFLFDSNFAPIVGPLGSGEIANVIVNPNGSTTATGSTFTGGSALASEIPEPGSVLLSFTGLGALALLRRRVR
jgi:hypothetical protein